MRKAWMVLAVVLAAGCADLKDQKTPVSPDDFQDNTDPSSCKVATPSNATILGTWRSQMMDGHGNTILTTTIISDSTGGTTYSRICNYPGLQLQIGPMFVASFVNTQTMEYHLTSNNVTSKSGVDANDVPRTCTLEVHAIDYVYQYRGLCVDLRETHAPNGGTLIR